MTPPRRRRRTPRRRRPTPSERRTAASLARALLQEAAAGRPRPSLCEVCQELHLRIVYDHDHSSGEFRGWLCDRCNRLLGQAYDSPRLLRALAQYLETHQTKER